MTSWSALYLDAILPLSRVDLVAVDPLHGALPVPHVVEPHALVNVAARVLARAPTVPDIVHPVTLIVRLALIVIIHTTLEYVRSKGFKYHIKENKKRVLHFEITAVYAFQVNYQSSYSEQSDNMS